MDGLIHHIKHCIILNIYVYIIKKFIEADGGVASRSEVFDFIGRMGIDPKQGNEKHT
ncbi:MAG: hypothetical protein QXP91_12010 [Candidatus Methanomethylicia archaeon]